MDPEYWKRNFLYPFALDPAPLRLDASGKQTPQEIIAERKRLKLMSEENLIVTAKYNFPLAQIKKPDEFIPEISNPITFTLEEIKNDMH